MSRNYSSTATTTELSAGVTDAATSIVVASASGFPSTPYILAIDGGTTSQELVLVTNVAGTTLTVTRGYDSTSAVAHLAGAVVQHSHAAIDFRETATHIDATDGVHGVTGDVVGTTDTQTLTNKTLTTPTLSGYTASRFVTTDGSGNVVASAKTIPTGDAVGTSDSQTLTNKTVALGSNTLSGTLAQFNTALTDADFVSLAGSETLTNKNLTSATNTFPTSLVTLTGSQTLTNKSLTSPTITGVGQVQRVVKPADEAVTSSTTLQDDDDLLFSATSGATYIFDLYVSARAAASSVDIKVGFSFPTGTMNFGVAGLASTLAAGNDGDATFLANPSATSDSTAIGIGVSSSAGTPIIVRGSFVASASGTVALQWAQLTSSATAMAVQAGSWLRAERVS